MNGLSGSLRHGVLALLAAACAGVAAAQPTTVIEPSAALRCLEVTDPKLPEPEYPFEEYKSRQPGSVTLSLRFTGPDLAPDVEVLASEGGPEFVLSTQRFASSLRVPCLGAGETATLTQVYDFRTNVARVRVMAAQEASLARQQALLECRQHVSGERAPPFPMRARERDIAGNVIVRLRYTAPDQAPEVVQLAHRRNTRLLAREVDHWVRGYRLPCFVPGRDEPLTITMTFVFRFTGHPQGFTALTLPQFMHSTRGIARQTLQLDTHTMDCPFDVLLQYRKPYMPNHVASAGEQLASREPLLAWLREAELQLQPRDLDVAYGDTADITVPCMKIDLKPKE